MILKTYQLAIAFSLLVGFNAMAANEAGESTGMMADCRALHVHSAGNGNDTYSRDPKNNVCSKITSSTKQSWSSLCERVAGYSFIIVKTLVDAATLYTTLGQMGAIETYGYDLGYALVTEPCAVTDTLCLSNRDDQVSLAKGAYFSDVVITAGFSGMAIILDSASLVAYACSPQDSLKGSCAGNVIVASGFASLASMGGALAANGCLWDTILTYKDGLSAKAIDSLNKAIRKGIPVVVLDSISGISGTVVGCLILAK